MIFEHNFLGRSGFYWFMGVVEDRMDPLKLGRVRVRCHGWHTNIKAEIPTEQLFWASVSQPTTSAANSGVGETPNIPEGTWCWGFFLDGVEAQKPMVCGTYAGIPQDPAQPSFGFSDPRRNTNSAPAKPTPSYTGDGTGTQVTNADRGSYPLAAHLDEPDTPRLARNDDGLVAEQNTNKAASRNAGQVNVTTATGGTFSEPESPYNAVYPYNQAKVTESGHAFELDDSRGAERVHLYHRAGSFFEMHPDGTVVDKAVNDSYKITHKDDYVHIEGKRVVTIDKGLEVLVNKDAGSNNYTIKVGAGGNVNITVVQGNVNLTLQNGNIVESITGNVTRTITGNVSETINGNFTRSIGGTESNTITGSSTRSVGSSQTETITGSSTLTTGAHTHTVNGALTVSASATTLTSPLTVNGNTIMNGTLAVSGAVTAASVVAAADVRAGGGSVGLLTHTHTDPQGGVTGTGVG